MAANASALSAPWSDRIKRSAIILLVTALVLGGLVVLTDLSLARGIFAFVCIAAAALVPWQLHEGAHSREAEPRADPVDAAVVRSLVTGLPDPSVLLDRAGRVLHFNPAAAELAPALRRGELAQSALRSPEIVATLRQALAINKPQRTNYVDHAPIERWMELVVTPIPVPTHFGGSDTCMLMTFHDQTPLRRVEEMRADFVANASHELRTPLAALSGFIDTLQGPAKEDAAARERFLGIMRAQATRMARLIDDLLSLSRIELSAHVRPSEPVDLIPLLNQVVDGLEPLARERGVAIAVDIPEGPVIVPGDRDELLRLFENLIENGLKYGASGGKVDVALTEVPASESLNEVRVTVRDYGPGIAPEHLPRLTERFYRVDVGDSRAQGGTGLGLSLVKHILNRHRGRLLIESVLEKGATFTAILPRAASPQKI
ncbi:ATP-binding protein [Bradyrhizobium sp. LHD-71]|uniref:ATP-binding protein n=1 Tax=Bradyrhizobium sp. LHD-71 TaxID=3072141 RepID=UPI00280E0A19|nr:ATP-binding protein [Bradyrhizobium sp. LHD-71]MDQ8730306.1 ATP-binding protein [Bradyrhizobium sp. LHD-71]